MRRTGLLILYVVATAIALGGVGDLTVRALFGIGIASFALVPVSGVLDARLRLCTTP
jgi:hypothetical protein